MLHLFFYINNIKIMEEEIKMLKEEINKMKNEKNNEMIYKKIADNFRQFRDDMHNLFCVDESDIYKKSKNNSVYYLKHHLYEIHTKKYNSYSPVHKNPTKWKEIYNDVIEILKTTFNIDDIEVFFEIIDLTEYRNNISHTNEPISLDELKSVSLHPDEIYECYLNFAK